MTPRPIRVVVPMSAPCRFLEGEMSGVIFDYLAIKASDKVRKFIGRDRPAEVIALAQGTAPLAQVGFLFRGLDTFGDHRHVEAAAKIDDGGGDPGIVIVDQQV